MFALSLLTALVAAASIPADRANSVLVLVSDLDTRNTHSRFLNALEKRGYSLDVQEASSPDVLLQEFGVYKYSKLVLFSADAEKYPNTVSARTIGEFVDAGGDVLVTGAEDLATVIRSTGADNGVFFDAAGTVVIDHFNAAPFDQGDNIAILSSEFSAYNTPIYSKPSKPLAFQGVAHVIDPASSLLIPLVRAPSTAYSAVPGVSISDPSAPKGNDIVLVSALQARNNARMIFAGSLDMFSNAFAVPSTSNAEFVDAIAQWVFHETGLLRTGSVSHHKQGESEALSVYTIRDAFEISVLIEERTGDSWKPYTGGNVQLEMVMLDPYWRLKMNHTNTGLHSAAFALPDVYGVFHYRISLSSVGYSFIDLRENLLIRPFRHDQYERFIPAAFPYYAGTFSMMIGFFIFSFVFLYHK